jgi:hypothetical protein
MNEKKINSASQEGTMGDYDVLSMYHHAIYPIEAKLHDLLEVLEQPRNVNIDSRFKKLYEILDEKFCLELVHRLELGKSFNAGPESKNESFNKLSLTGEPNFTEIIFHKPVLILHLWCSLICSDSIEYIAKHANLTLTEALAFIREIDFSYNIDSLISRVLNCYQASRKHRLQAEISKNQQLLGLELTTVSPDSNEERRARLRRKYGDLANIKKHLLLS